MRKTITLAMIIVGVGLMLAGYFLAAPWGADRQSAGARWQTVATL